MEIFEIRADYDRDGIVVYQAYGRAIGEPAVAAGRFVPPFSRDRMTWIKPSFLWLMGRSGWAGKPGQEMVLAVRITREGWEKALREAVRKIRDLLRRGREDKARALLPPEKVYPLPEELALSLGMRA